MGSSTSGPAFARKMQAAGRAIKQSETIGIAGASLVVKKAVAVAAGRYAGSNLTKVSYTISKFGERSQSLVRMTSRKAHLLERDTKGHDERPRKYSARSKKTGSGALNILGVGPRASAHHPGTKGKHIFEKGVAAAIPLIGKEYDRALVIELRKALG